MERQVEISPGDAKQQNEPVVSPTQQIRLLRSEAAERTRREERRVLVDQQDQIKGPDERRVNKNVPTVTDIREYQPRKSSVNNDSRNSQGEKEGNHHTNKIRDKDKRRLPIQAMKRKPYIKS